MEPRIQYAKTADGVSIAYSMIGHGSPMVLTSPAGWSHVGLEWSVPPLRAWHERLAETKTVVRFDIRGTGLSDREALSLSVDTFAVDLNAVVDDLGFDRFALMGLVYGSRSAIVYAASHPERLSHLLLWQAFAGPGVGRIPQAEAVMSLVDKDWELFTEIIAHASLGWEAGQRAHSLATYMRESVTQEAYRAMVEAALAVDVTNFLAQITVPTLVMQRRQAVRPIVAQASELASRIRGARLALFEGTSPSPSEGDMEAVIAAIDDFLGEGEGATPEATPPETGAFRTILFTDLVGHTEMMARLGDAKGRQVLREHERITRDVLKQHGGTEVKTMGDGFMASFGSVTKAVECAIALQKAFDDRNRGLGAHHDAPLQVRCGLNAGEPIEEEGDLFGATVILAARIAAKADGGEILVANAVRELCAGKGFLFGDRGDFVAKGFEEPVRVYEVRWRD